MSPKAEDYHGMARYERTLPDVAGQGVKSINVEISFEEALKLSLALQSCLIQLNRYHRGSAPGREMGVLLSIKTENTSISVIEKRVRSGE
jgi:hypothetical protein